MSHDAIGGVREQPRERVGVGPMIETKADEGALAVQMRLQIRRIHVPVNIGMVDNLTRRKLDHAVDIHSTRNRAIAILCEVVRYHHAAERPADQNGLARV